MISLVGIRTEGVLWVNSAMTCGCTHIFSWFLLSMSS